MTKRLVLTALLTGLCVAGSASASEVFVRKTVNLRAGPGTQYPVVDRIGKGSVLEIYGCIDGWGWCEIGYDANRGWVLSKYIETSYNQRNVRIIEVAPQMQVPVIVYQAGPFWDEYYRDKPFYSQRQRWVTPSHDAYTGHGESHAVRPSHDDRDDRGGHDDQGGHGSDDHGRHGDRH